MLENIIPPRLKGVFGKRPQGLGEAWRKRALILAGFVLALLVIGHLGVRFVLWPQIEKSKTSIERLISARIGADVSMDKLEVSWTGMRPSFELEGLRFNGPEKTKPLLFIQKINGELSWNSFYHFAPYFHELNFHDAQIYVRRDSKGQITIAGLPVHGKTDDYTAENWLFAQNDINISDVKLFWDDQKSQKQLSTIDIQSLTLSNGIRKHQGALTATTPWTNGPVEIKVNFAHRLTGQAGNWHDWIGAIEWNLSDVNLTQIAKEFKLRPNTLEGIASSKGKLNIDNSKPDGGEIYLAADNLILQLSKDEDAIALGRLETNLTQETIDGMISITTKTFAWREMVGPKNAPLDNLSPMTFRWRPPGADGEIKEFGFSSPKILVEDVALFALNLPLSKKVHRWIKDSHADGELQNLDINWSESKSPLAALNIPGGWFKSNKLDFNISAKLINLSFMSVDKTMPSVANLSGFLTSNQTQGSFTVDSKKLDLDIKGLLVEPKIQLDQAKGQIAWAKTKGNWVVSAKDLSLSNSEVTTQLDLNYIVGNSGQSNLLSLDMSFPTAKLSSAYRYLPVDMDKDTHHYLSKAFSAGSIQDGKLHIKGDPKKIPFPKGIDGEFSLNLPVTGVTYSPVPTITTSQGVWPAFTNVDGIIAMQNELFTVDISKANFKQVALSKFHAEIPSVSAKQLVLSVNGNAQGESAQMLDYLLASPVGKKQANLEKDLHVSGNAGLDLGLKIPLSGNAETNVDIKLTLPGNQVQWGEIPPLENLKGKIRITDTNPEFEDVTANFLGGSLKIATAPSTPGNQNYSIIGDIRANFIKNYFANHSNKEVSALTQALSGSVKYDGSINFSKAGGETNLKFDLRDFGSAAPYPVSKAVGIPMNGQITLKNTQANKSNPSNISWAGKIGDLYAFQGAIGADKEYRAALGIGGPANLPQQGFSLNLAVNELNFDAWHDFFNGQTKTISNQKDPGPSNSNSQITAQIKKLTAFERNWNDVGIVSTQKNGTWQIRLLSQQAAGQIQLQEASQSHPNGVVNGSLSRLKVPDSLANELSKTSTSTSANKKVLEPNDIPSLDLTIEDFSWSKAQLGHVKIKTHSSNNVLKLDSIQANNPQGITITSGQWTGANQNQAEHTQLKINSDVKDAGQLIAHWSTQKSVEGGQGQVLANVEWDGSPFNPQYETFKGKTSLSLTKGRLLEVDTSGAQILDVLSLQSLFKFATLDLQGSLGNIVTKGTAFSSINGAFDINNGIAQTTQFSMDLDQARVAMNGQINIGKQTQDLRITIFPTIDATAGSLAAFAINPIIGLSALVGQYLITSQINRNFQSDYLVQGSWKSPEVIPLDQKGQPIDLKTLDSIRSKDLLKEQNKPTPNNSSNGTNNPSAPL
jgi:uncharacterized protein (TIGR02099 family)